MHPLAWWAWALALAVATTRTEDPLVVALLLAAVVGVVLLRGDARAFRLYVVLGAAIVLFRVGFHVLVGLKPPGTVVLDLPRVALPDWAAGVQMLGPVTLEGLGVAAGAGLRLAVLVACFGAANCLADPRRALRSLPAALHQVGSAVVIAVSVAPQLVAAVTQVRHAQRLRGDAVRGVRLLPRLVVPVLADALDRSLALAASMDSRGYARTAGRPGRWTGVLLLGALVALGTGAYGLLDATAPAWLGGPMVAGGALAAAVAVLLAGRGVRRTRYRADRWGVPEWVVVAAGVGAAVVVAAVPVLPLLAAWPGLGGVVAAGSAALATVPGSAVPVRPRSPGPHGRPALAGAR